MVIILPENEAWIPITNDIVPNIMSHYLISTYGRIYNQVTGNYLPQNRLYNKDKYITIHLSTYNGSVCAQPHRLVAMVFLGCVEGYEHLDVNHKDGIKYHNWLWNLEWCTKSENVQHAIRNDLFNLGETRDNSILTNDQANQICKLIENGLSANEIDKEMKLNNCDIKKIVQNIKNGHSWKHISKNYDFSNAYRKERFSEEEINKICRYFQDNGTSIGYREILKYLGYNDKAMDQKTLDVYNAAICGIRNRKGFKIICDKYYY
jgi:hypothetical protein